MDKRMISRSLHSSAGRKTPIIVSKEKMKGAVKERK